MKRFIRKRIIRNNNNKFVTLNLCNETIGFSLLQRRAGCSICTEILYLWRYVWLSFSYFKAIVAFKLARRASTLMPVRSSTLSALSLSLLSLKLCVYGYVCVCVWVREETECVWEHWCCWLLFPSDFEWDFIMHALLAVTKISKYLFALLFCIYMIAYFHFLFFIRPCRKLDGFVVRVSVCWTTEINQRT